MTGKRCRVAVWIAMVLLGAGVVRGQTIYVATNGTHDVGNNFDTWGGAATNLNEAVTLANVLGHDVLVSNGVFGVTQDLAVGNFEVRSLNGPAYTTVYRIGSAGTSFPIFNVTEADALVSGFTITNGYWSTAGNDRGGSVHMTSGTVTNCWIINTPYIGGTQSGAVFLSGGMMTHCVISNSQPRSFALKIVAGTIQDSLITRNHEPYDNGPIVIAGGTMRRCRVLGNSAGNNGVGAIYLTNGRIENTLISGNRTTGTARPGGVRQAGGALVNVTIAANTNAAGATVGAGVARTGGAITNSIIHGNSGAGGMNYSGLASVVWHSCAPELTPGENGNITNSPMFIDAAAGDFRLAFGSPCIDTGTNLVDITHDINLTPRPLDGNEDGNAITDMGAFEAPDPNMGPLQVSFEESTQYGFTPLDVVFSTSTMGTNRTIVWYGWDFDNDGTFNLTGSDLGIATGTYENAGIYSVYLEVTNSAGETASFTLDQGITVANPFICVATNGGHIAPFKTWETAATNLNEAIAMAVDTGVTVLVSNGVYGVTNQLVVANATVKSLNGPGETTVYRIGTTGSPFPIWRLYSGGYVTGFSVTNGHWDANSIVGGAFHMTGGTVSNCVMTLNNRIGGSNYDNGILAASGGAIITHCIISNNTSRSWNITLSGAGTTMRNTTFTRNTAPWGSTGLRLYSGAVVERCRIVDNDSTLNVVSVETGSSMENCLVWGNRNTHASGGTVNMSGAGSRIVHCTIANNHVAATSAAGGLVRTGGTVTNSIIYGNLSTVPQFAGDAASVWYSCAPELTADVQGNININPMFADMEGGDCTLVLGSPAVNRGVYVPDVIVDLDGNARDANPDMGAFEWAASGGPLQVAFLASLPRTGIGTLTNVFTTALDGDNTDIIWWGWDFNNDGNFTAAGAGLETMTNIFVPGRYSITLQVTNSLLETASATVFDYITVQSAGLNVYMSTNGTATFPFDTWEMATSDLNDALANAARAGSTVWVADGVFGVTSELTLSTNITVTSMHGPQATTVYRTQTGGAVTYPIFRLTHADAWVSGFTITNGFWNVTGRGGSIDMTAGIVTNCWIVNTPYIGGQQGGAVYMTGGLVTHSVISNSQPRSFALRVAGGTIQDSLVTHNYDPYDSGPVGVLGGTMRRCRIQFNSAGGNGRGGLTLSAGLIESVLIVSNSTPATAHPGGVLVSGGRMINCTVAGNVNNASGTVGSGLRQTGGSITNSIIYGNTGSGGVNYTATGGTIGYSLAPELTPGVNGNLIADPLFADADYRLAAESPAVGTGIYQDWMDGVLDLDGNSRGRPGRVDMGCYQRMPPRGSLFLLK